ncbi:hypothetical protein ACWIUD_01230 [Helicobacter sp. 23-1044]
MKTRGLISGNLSLGMQFAHDSSLRGARSEASATKQSTPNRHTEHSEVSKTRESNENGESMTQKRINGLDSPINDKNLALEIC